MHKDAIQYTMKSKYAISEENAKYLMKSATSMGTDLLLK